LFDFLADTLLSHRSFSFDSNEYTVTQGPDRGDGLTGTDTPDTVFGLGGDDSVSTLGGDDHIQGDDGNDMLDGGDGRDSVVGGDRGDRLLGGTQSDELMGGDGNDYLGEGAAHGMLEGDRDDDILFGGPGADAFMVSSASGNDEVRDFQAAGDAPGAFDHIAFMDIQADEVIAQDTGRGALVSWDMDGDSGADGSILLAGVPVADLRQSDFMFGDAPQFVAGVSDFGPWYIFPDSSDSIA
jgi:Ca2+-binding RTX toxin-like protein